MSSPGSSSIAKVTACYTEAVRQVSPDTSLSPSSPWTLIGDEVPNDTDWEMQLPSPMERDLESQASLTALMQGTGIATEHAITLPFAADTMTGEGQRREILQQLQAYLEDEKTQAIRDHFITMVSELIAPKGQSKSASGGVSRMRASMVHGQEVDDPGDPWMEESGEFHLAGERAWYRKSRLNSRPAATEDHAAQETPKLKRRRHEEGVGIIRLRLHTPRAKKRPFTKGESADSELGVTVGDDTAAGTQASKSGKKRHRPAKLPVGVCTPAGADDSSWLVGPRGDGVLDGHGD